VAATPIAPGDAAPKVPAAALALLLPAREALAGTLAEAPNLARLLGRADREAAATGDEAQVLRHFDLLPRGLPIAALTRENDAQDAANQAWLRADPAFVRADLGAGRLMACGDLGLSRDEAEALVAPLKPLFGDAGCPISVGAPSRWYLALPRDARLPDFVPPSRVLGDDIFAHLPEGELGRRWRHLLSEAQVMLHHHPLNAKRVAAGRPPVNSLWFWGGGVAPDHVRSGHARVLSDDLLLAVLGRRAAIADEVLPASLAPEADESGVLIDLRRVRDLAALDRHWIEPAVQRVRDRRSDCVLLDFADGERFTWRNAHRWRLWRRPAATLA
jgi:hypothetical protein